MAHLYIYTKRWNRIVLLCAALLTSLFSTFSCSSEPPPQQFAQRKIPLFLIIPNGSPVGRTEVAAPAPPCPQEGTGCFQYPNGQPSLLFARENYASLKSYANSNDLERFFETVPNWEDMFPGMGKGSPAYYKLISGEYKLHFFEDSSIAVYDTTVSLEAASNLVYLYKWGNF